MAFKYYAIVNHEVIDFSNSLKSLKSRMEEYHKSFPWETIYIITGVRNPMIIQEYDTYNEKWYQKSNRYKDLFHQEIKWK